MLAGSTTLDALKPVDLIINRIASKRGSPVKPLASISLYWYKQTEAQRHPPLILLQWLVNLLNTILCDNHHLQTIANLNMSLNCAVKRILNQVLHLTSR